MAMNIYQLLKDDHDHMKDLFKQIKRKKAQNTDQIFNEIQKELTIHMEGEEKLFYPLLEKEEPTHEKALEAWEEHHVAKTVLQEMLKMSKDDEHWHAKLSVLEELVEHHIEEEEGELFRKAKKVVAKEQAEEIGMRYEQQKQQMMGQKK
jgi:hemerythrin superfamily protein